MKIIVKALTTPLLAASNENPGLSAQVYRLAKCFAVVQFDQTPKGRIVFLPEGAELRIVGCSRLSECVEVECGNQIFNIFEADLFGPWSTPAENRQIQPVQRMVVGVCA